MIGRSLRCVIEYHSENTCSFVSFLNTSSIRVNPNVVITMGNEPETKKSFTIPLSLMFPFLIAELSSLYP